VQRAVIRIQTTTCDGGEIGTGFLVGRRLVATVEHVVDGATSIELKRDGHVLGMGVVIGEDAARDVALVRSSARITGPLLRLATRSPRLGESVAALGFPFGLPLTVTQGAVSGLDRTIPINGVERSNLVQTDAAVNPGNSGGPLISLDTDEVVGLVDLGTAGTNGISFAVSARVAQPLLQVWHDSPQVAPLARCTPTNTAPATTTTATSTTATTATPTVPSYSGTAFSVEYPPGWIIDAAEQHESWGTDTLISPPRAAATTNIRIDVSRNQNSTNLRAIDQPEINAVSREPGYSLIALDTTTVAGYPALHWEFTVDEAGVRLKKEDDFFVDTDNHDGVAILTEAPATEYTTYKPLFAAVRQTLTMN
jgi:hypothetical protein